MGGKLLSKQHSEKTKSQSKCRTFVAVPPIVVVRCHFSIIVGRNAAKKSPERVTEIAKAAGSCSPERRIHEHQKPPQQYLNSSNRRKSPDCSTSTYTLTSSPVTSAAEPEAPLQLKLDIVEVSTMLAQQHAQTQRFVVPRFKNMRASVVQR